MDEINKYQQPEVVRSPYHYEEPPSAESSSNPSIIRPIFRRWYIVLLTAVLTCAIGVPAVWFLVKPTYTVTGAIRVAPVLSNILTGKSDTGDISNYNNFMNTQAVIITSSQVIERVADNLVDKKLSFFDPKSGGFDLKKLLKGQSRPTDPAGILKQAITNGDISANTSRNTELINVTMTGKNSAEAQQIVNAIINVYMDVEVAKSLRTEKENMDLLDKEYKQLDNKLASLREDIFKKGEEYGSTTLGPRYDMKLELVKSRLNILGELEATRINLETQIQMLKPAEERKAENLIRENAVELKDLQEQLLKKYGEVIPAEVTRPNEEMILKAKDELEKNLLMPIGESTVNSDELKKMSDRYLSANPMIIEFIAGIISLDETLSSVSKVSADPNVGMLKDQVCKTYNEMMTAKMERITREKQTGDKTPSVGPEEMVQMRNQYVNSDSTIAFMTSSYTRLEEELIVAGQRLAPSNPELKLKENVLETLKERLANLKRDAEEKFDSLMAEKIKKTAGQGSAPGKYEEAEGKLFELLDNLQQVRVHEARVTELLATEDDETIKLGRKQLDIQKLQEEVERNKERYDRIGQRIAELAMESKRPARVSVAYYASIASVNDKRAKFTAAILMGSLAFGAFLAIMRDKADRSLYTPSDINRQVGIKIIGTTTSSDGVKRSLLPQQISDDYQNIRATLELLNGSGIPKKLVITSPGRGDGKTTFSVNLASSLARTGKKILLIDGDLRKGDIRGLLGLREKSKNLQDVLRGAGIDSAIISSTALGYDILAASKHTSDAMEFLTVPNVRDFLKKVSTIYDHVIIDTPPVMAFSDALVWAKLGDGVIVVSLAGHTINEDLRETYSRLERIGAKVLGSILNNVPLKYSYNSYGYGYGANPSSRAEQSRNRKTTFLLPEKKEKPDSEQS